MTFEESLPLINKEIEKRRSMWRAPIYWMNYDDVAQLIRHHIWTKWEKFDQSRPLKPWIAQVVHNQFYNILRNNYSNKIKNPDSAAIAMAMHIEAVPAESYFLQEKDECLAYTWESLNEKLMYELEPEEYFIFRAFYLEKRTTQALYKEVSKEFPRLTQKEIREIRDSVKIKIIDYVKGDNEYSEEINY